MGSKLRVIVAAGVLVALVMVVSFVTFAQAGGGKQVVHVIEHAESDFVIDTDGDGADSTGDLLTFANKVFDDADQQKAGTDLGTCVRIDPAKGSWQCMWTVFLDGGQITVSGPFYDTRDSVLAIIGGTGSFSGATGNMKLVSKNGGLEYDFIYRLGA